MLETHIRGEGKALLANLRAFPPRGTRNEVWNHGVGKYTAEYHAIPGRGPLSVRLTVSLEGNSGSSINGQDEAPRVVKYEYTLVYGLDGRVDLANAWASDWVSVGGEGMYAPLNILQVINSRWQGHNPLVTEANVRALDRANGGAGGPLAGTARQFRTAAEYEAGRPAYVGNRPSVEGPSGGSSYAYGGGGSSNAGSPRRGFFQALFGR
jgi:hypothetical protein